MRRSTQIAAVVVAICLILLVFWYSRPKTQSDSELVANQIQTAVSGANHHSIGQIMSVVSPQYEDDNGMNSISLRAMLNRAFRSSPQIGIDMTQPAIVVNGNSARSVSNLTVRENSTGQIYFNHPVTLTWSKERGYTWLVIPTPTWRIVKADYGPPVQMGD